MSFLTFHQLIFSHAVMHIIAASRHANQKQSDYFPDFHQVYF